MLGGIILFTFYLLALIGGTVVLVLSCGLFGKVSAAIIWLGLIVFVVRELVNHCLNVRR